MEQKKERGNPTYNNLCIFIVFIFIFPDLNVLVQFSFKSRFHGGIAMRKLLPAVSSTLPSVTKEENVAHW